MATRSFHVMLVRDSCKNLNVRLMKFISYVLAGSRINVDFLTRSDRATSTNSKNVLEYGNNSLN